MEIYDIGIAWEWDLDKDFIFAIHDALIKKGITCYLIDPYNIHITYEKIINKKLNFRVFYDRASDSRDEFLDLAKYFDNQKICLNINPYTNSRKALDKATMHLEFLENGIVIPYTEILAPYHENTALDIQSWKDLGKPFVVKPACGGGGQGVVHNAENENDVHNARQAHIHDKSLVQTKIYPMSFNGKRGWFRVFYVFGLAIPCWWNDVTKLYTEMDIAEERDYKLGKLRSTARKIGSVCGLNFFSTELCVTKDYNFICVDYVNDPCDMRFLSHHKDGIPDTIINKIIDRMVTVIKEYLNTRVLSPES